MLEALDYSNHVNTRSNVKKLNYAKMILLVVLERTKNKNKNKKIMLKERWTKSKQLQIIIKVKLYEKH